MNYSLVASDTDSMTLDSNDLLASLYNCYTLVKSSASSVTGGGRKGVTSSVVPFCVTIISPAHELPLRSGCSFSGSGCNGR